MKKTALFMLLAIGLAACHESDNGIEVSWTNSGVITYQYGSSPGWTFRREFVVTGEQSGEMTATATCNENEVSCTEFVESGGTYSLSVSGTTSSFRTLYAVSVNSPVFEAFSINNARSVTGIGIK
ncbi:MAG: hypothetical protein V2B15_14210 [Bacteroidota bacterium]